MFELERQLSPETASRIVASESRRLSAREQQRDVYESHRHRVFAVGYYMTANELEAEDLMADTFVSAFEQHRSPDANAVDRALIAQLEKRFSLEAAEPAVADTELLLAKASTRRTDMEEALRVLPPAERLIFLLRDVEGYATARIATVLDCSENEVQRTLFSARIRMRNALAAAEKAAALAHPIEDALQCAGSEFVQQRAAS